MTAFDHSLTRQLEVLYADHHGWLRSWLRRKLGNAFDAADLAHDTYLRILRTGNVPDAEQSRRHLAQVANGLVIDLYRRRHIEAVYLESIAHLPSAQVPSEESRALVIEALMEVDAILCTLQPKVRAALLLSKMEGLGYREIAQRLHVSISTVERYMVCALLACDRAVHGA